MKKLIAQLFGFAVLAFATVPMPLHAQSSLQAALAAKAATTVVITPHVRAELLAYAPEGVQAGGPLVVGLQIQHQPHWHTYWKNAGDSGLPTQLNWKLPGGIDAGEIAWPTPKKIPVANLANYGYEGTVLLPVPLTVASTFQSMTSEVTIALKAQWLVCKTECIPEEGDFAIKLPLHGSTALARPLFEAAQKGSPKVHGGKAVFTPEGESLKLTVQDLPADWQGRILEAFPEDGDIIETAAKPVQTWSGRQWSAVLPLSSLRASSPSTMAWVIKISSEKSEQSIRVQATSDGAWQANATVKPASMSPALSAALEQNKAEIVTDRSGGAAYWLAVAGALLGGLILNLMPCVLPVLAIKLLGFTLPRSQLSPRHASGLFALGVISSFVLLGAALLLLRSAGQSLGWGFQLQSPGVVLALALLFLLIGLNLFGVFDIRLFLPARITGLQTKNPSLEALASGALAVLVATPCTAPFMGASLGLAITLPAWQALLIFAALGLGMALPFVAVAIFPSIAKWLAKTLPKPGVWMERFKAWLAWPMFITAAWLLWVFALQINAQKSVQPVSATQEQTVWQEWSAHKQNDARVAGRPVFVDFTAAWCITCQVNKSTTLTNAEVQNAFKAKNVLLLRADWTSPNAEIAAELAKLGRSGLPVYAFYLPGAATAQVLPEVLTKTMVLEVLSAL